MRLYKRVKQLGSGVTADNVNKGLLLINTSTNNALITVNILNYNQTTTAITFDVLKTNATTSLQSAPAHCIIPFTVKSWSGVTAVNGYTLY
jgi:hypothetical protein